MITVVVAEGQPVGRTRIATRLSGHDGIEVVAEAGDGAAAVNLARVLRPDVVVMGVDLPEAGGVEATRRLAGHRVGDRPGVVLVGRCHLAEVVYPGLRAGAAGFVARDSDPEVLGVAVRAAHLGGGWLDPRIARRLAGQLAVPRSAPEGLGLLTPREREVLLLMAHGLTNAEICRHLTVKQSTVKTHVRRILLKLNLRDRTGAVVAAYRTGLVQPGEPLPPAST